MATTTIISISEKPLSSRIRSVEQIMLSPDRKPWAKDALTCDLN
jgi:hypothetical protein